VARTRRNKDDTVGVESEDMESARLAAIVESSDDAIIGKDLSGTIISWNRAAETLFGYSSDEAVGNPVTILIPEDRFNEEPEILEKIRQGKKIEHYETVRRRKDGSLLDISLSVSPIVDKTGQVIGASKIVRDITETKAAGADRSRLAAIVDSSDDAIISKDLDGTITSWNRGAQRIFGYTADEIIGRPITILIPEERHNEEPGILEKIRNGERIDHYQTVRRRKDGSLLDISLSVSPIADSTGKIIGAAKIARDITEQIQSNKITRESEIMLRMIEVQEAERYRIARDIHDHLGQSMTGLRFKLEALADAIKGDPALEAKTDEIGEMAARLDQDLAYLSWELRPTELEHLGLVDALQSFVREWSNQYGINAGFHATEISNTYSECRLSRNMETNLYRIVQEALNNVLKHSEATSVEIVLQLRSKDLVLTIEDNGKGFDPDVSSSRDRKFGGQGLIGMRERAEWIGGSLEIESTPGKGTTLWVRTPCDRSLSNA